MAANSTIPVTVTEEAQSRISELGMQRQFEQIIEHTKQVVSGLKSIEVVLDYDPYSPWPEKIVVEAFRFHPDPGQDRTEWDWNGWIVEAFPLEVFVHFLLNSVYEDTPDGR